jgi:hypothetical protein
MRVVTRALALRAWLALILFEASCVAGDDVVFGGTILAPGASADVPVAPTTVRARALLEATAPAWHDRGKRERVGVPLWKPPGTATLDGDAAGSVTGADGGPSPSPPSDAEARARDDGVVPIEPVDLETPGAFESALEARARASDREIMILAVGDTRDHRRVRKDPSLSVISSHFVANLVANLRALGLRNYLLLASSERLCRDLRLDGCAWSSRLTDSRGLRPWGIDPGDMFLVWAQQWHYVERALRLGYGVTRVDSDVVFLEDPYPILRGALLAPFAVVFQTDVFGAETRPTCQDARDDADASRSREGLRDCGAARRDPELNVGLTYFRAGGQPSGVREDGPVVSALREFNDAFLRRLGGAPVVNDRDEPVSQELLDQPMLRAAFAKRAARGGGWRVADGAFAPARADAAADDDDAAAAAVAADRARTAFPYAALTDDGKVTELAAGAPDWLFGRGCAKTLLNAADALAHLGRLRGDAKDEDAANAEDVPVVEFGDFRADAGTGLVAVHMVYSMASKRAEVMRAMGWWWLASAAETAEDVEAASNRSRTCPPAPSGANPDPNPNPDPNADPNPDPGGERPDLDLASNPRGVVFSHTHFRQWPAGSRAFACAGRASPGTTPCCAAIPDADDDDDAWAARVGEGLHLARMNTEDAVAPMSRDGTIATLAALPGCGMTSEGGWNEFWDR